NVKSWRTDYTSVFVADEALPIHSWSITARSPKTCARKPKRPSRVDCLRPRSVPVLWRWALISGMCARLDRLIRLGACRRWYSDSVARGVDQVKQRSCECTSVIIPLPNLTHSLTCSIQTC